MLINFQEVLHTSQSNPLKAETRPVSNKKKKTEKKKL